jgi:hypothetical protein
VPIVTDLPGCDFGADTVMQTTRPRGCMIGTRVAPCLGDVGSCRAGKPLGLGPIGAGKSGLHWLAEKTRMDALKGIAALLVVLIKSRASLAAENLALRQQLAVLMRSMKRPKLRRRDRLFWAWLSRFWPGRKTVLVIVKPETVIRWPVDSTTGTLALREIEIEADKTIEQRSEVLVHH